MYHVFRLHSGEVREGLVYINSFADTCTAAEFAAVLDKKYPKHTHIVLSDTVLMRSDSNG